MHSWGEFVDFPTLLDEFQSWLSTKGAASKIWVHSWRMVTPDAKLFNISDLSLSLEGQLGKCSIVIKSRHGSEVFRWNTLSSSDGIAEITEGTSSGDN